MTPTVLDVEIGHLFQGRPRRLTWARALALSGGPLGTPGWPDRNLHTDMQAANEAGLSEVVVSGTQWAGYVAGLMVELFGAAWFSGGELDFRIPRSVKIDETLCPGAKLEERQAQGDGILVRMSVWCENQDGERVLTGTGSCRVPLAAHSGR